MENANRQEQLQQQSRKHSYVRPQARFVPLERTKDHDYCGKGAGNVFCSGCRK